VQTNLDTHEGLDGTNVHGLGTMAAETAGDYTKTADAITYTLADGTNTTARTETNGNERIFRVDASADCDTNAVWGNISGTLSDQLDLTQTVALAAGAYPSSDPSNYQGQITANAGYTNYAYLAWGWGNWALNDSISDYRNHRRLYKG